MKMDTLLRETSMHVQQQAKNEYLQLAMLQIKNTDKQSHLQEVDVWLH
jgi:hypothetical protein